MKGFLLFCNFALTIYKLTCRFTMASDKMHIKEG